MGLFPPVHQGAGMHKRSSCVRNPGPEARPGICWNHCLAHFVAGSLRSAILDGKVPSILSRRCVYSKFLMSSQNSPAIPLLHAVRTQRLHILSPQTPVRGVGRDWFSNSSCASPSIWGLC